MKVLKLVKIAEIQEKSKNSIDIIGENKNKEETNQKQYSINGKNSNLKKNLKNKFRENLLLVLTILSVIIGVVLGFFLRTFNFQTPQKQLFGFPGEIFLRMLKFLILPLMSSSLISGIASLGTSGNKTGIKQIASKALVFYFSTTFLAVILGIVLVILIGPGQKIKAQNINSVDPFGKRKISPIDAILDLVR